MRDTQLKTSLATLPCVTIGGIISTKRENSLVSLIEILDKDQVETRFFLSPTACRGILRRAENRGKDLPPILLRALSAVAEA